MKVLEAMGLTLKEDCFEEEKSPKPGEIWFDITDPSGHQHLVWNKRFPAELKEAQEKFYQLLDQGVKIFAVRTNGQREERQLLRFDPYAEHLVCIAPVRGG